MREASLLVKTDALKMNAGTKTQFVGVGVAFKIVNVKHFAKMVLSCWVSLM